MLPRSALPSAALAVVAAFVVGSCSEPATSGAQFCGALSDDMPVLAGDVATQEDIDVLVDTYTELDGRTPLAIEEAWHQLTVLVQTAATVAPDDPASVQAVANEAYASERSARTVSEWVQATCGFSMPRMSGIEGPVPTPPSAPTTTAAPTADSAPAPSAAP